jgi:hypothetical protein
METKPYNLQSPEQIAKDYGGNKQKIAEAMQMGLIDPTAGTMAGMFIDRMRSAAQQEATPQQTVAQQVMAPQPQMPMGAPQGAPPTPAGLGATPQAAAMPPMGAAPPMGMPAPQGEMPMMAMGGMVPPYASGGGLSSMPLPDGMFDEPSNGGFGDGYAGGGIIAFADAGPVEEPNKPKTPAELAEEEEQKRVNAYYAANGIEVSGKRPAAPDNSPESYYGNYKDPFAQERHIQDFYNPKREASESLMDLLKGEGSPEELKRRKKEDMWLALGQIGAKMASTPGSFLQAASAGMAEAIPGIRAAAKERKADQREAIKTMAQQEGLNNKEALDMYKLVQEGTNKYGEFDISRLNREQQERFALLQDKTERYKSDQAYKASVYGSRSAYDATMGSAGLALDRERLQQLGEARKMVFASIGAGGPLSFQYSQAPDKAAFIQDRVNEALGVVTGSSGNVVDVKWPGK